MANCGDFILIRSPANRNNPGGSIQEMLEFNEAISKLRINEAPLKDCKFTWTNKRMNPLLERLDWFFSSNVWITHLPNTVAPALSIDTSDHTPCIISASTNIPKPQVFKFENYWMELENFRATIQQGWINAPTVPDKAKNITSKFKHLKQTLKTWKCSSQVLLPQSKVPRT